jgi:hypothetical protein
MPSPRRQVRLSESLPEQNSQLLEIITYYTRLIRLSRDRRAHLTTENQALRRVINSLSRTCCDLRLEITDWKEAAEERAREEFLELGLGVPPGPMSDDSAMGFSSLFE